MRNVADPGAVEGDLRPVTILFADIRGFTRLAELLPPEKLVGTSDKGFQNHPYRRRASRLLCRAKTRLLTSAAW